MERVWHESEVYTEPPETTRIESKTENLVAFILLSNFRSASRYHLAINKKQMPTVDLVTVISIALSSTIFSNQTLAL